MNQITIHERFLLPKSIRKQARINLKKIVQIIGRVNKT